MYKIQNLFIVTDTVYPKVHSFTASCINSLPGGDTDVLKDIKSEFRHQVKHSGSLIINGDVHWYYLFYKVLLSRLMDYVIFDNNFCVLSFFSLVDVVSII